MFRNRLLTAVILIPLVLAGLYKTNALFFDIVLLLCFIGLGLEWLQLIPLKSRGVQCLFMAALLLAFGLIQLLYSYWLFAGLVIWAMLTFFILRYPKYTTIWGKNWVIILLGLFLLPLFIQSLRALFQLEDGRFFIIYLLILVWVSDSGAYIAGKLWGRHKLIPKVSPGKTIEGLIGGLLLSLFASFIGYFIFQPPYAIGWYFFITFMYFVTVVGDLFESMLKRRVDIKDSGQLFPGHGGMLDRLDSLIAASPFFYAGLHLLLHGY